MKFVFSSRRSVFSFVSLFVLTAAVCAQPVVLQPKLGDPLPGLSGSQSQRFDLGRVQFDRIFSVAEGLGPIFNQNSCSSCHSNPIGGSGTITVTRFGALDPKSGVFDPLMSLGGSLLQSQAISLACQEFVPPEATVTATRTTPSILGAGLVEAIPDADILAGASSPPAGVSGVAHMVVPLETPGGTARVGRFGWKAQVATVLTFSGDASQNEMGITNRLIPTENAPNGNLALLLSCDTVPDPEDVTDPQGFDFIDRITDFQRYLAAPPQTPRSGMSGEVIFNQIGCADCHTPSWTTSNDPGLEPALRNKTIRPYTDFLVHDMGLNADFIADGTVDQRELKTPPLWGLRVRDPMWHDGRVSGGTFYDRIAGSNGAIAAHDALLSESQASAQAFAALSSSDKQALVDFLASLGLEEFDGNGDGVVDFQDAQDFDEARSVPGVPVYGADAPEAVYDLDQDGDVDDDDFAGLVHAFEGDCNANGINDLKDIYWYGTSWDSNHNFIPDECEFCQPDLGGGGGSLVLSVCGDDLSQPGSLATFAVSGAGANDEVLIAVSPSATPTPLVGVGTLFPTTPFLHLINGFYADSNGMMKITIGGTGVPLTLFVQTATINGMNVELSNAVQITF